MVKRWPQPTDKPSLSVEVQYSPLIVTAQTIGQPNVGPGGDLQVSFLFKMTQWKNWTMLPKGCGKIYDTIIRSQRQIKRFGTWNPVGDLGFRFCCCCEQGSVIRAIRQKALATAAAVAAGLGWKADGWEGGAFGPGRAGRISGGRLGSRLGKRDPGQLILILFYPTQEGCKKAGGKKIRLNQMWNGRAGWC